MDLIKLWPLISNPLKSKLRKNRVDLCGVRVIEMISMQGLIVMEATQG